MIAQNIKEIKKQKKKRIKQLPYMVIRFPKKEINKSIINKKQKTKTDVEKMTSHNEYLNNLNTPTHNLEKVLKYLFLDIPICYIPHNNLFPPPEIIIILCLYILNVSSTPDSHFNLLILNN
jgi:hypothetical protein